MISLIIGIENLTPLIPNLPLAPMKLNSPESLIAAYQNKFTVPILSNTTW